MGSSRPVELVPKKDERRAATASPYHRGELEVQERAGVGEMAARVGKVIRPFVPSAARGFLLEQSMAVVASVDGAGRAWASMLTGEPGFLRAPDERTVAVGARPLPGDPLADALREGAEVGVLAIDLETRRRMKAKGVVERVLPKGGFEVRTERVYALCPKYIQARTWDLAADPTVPEGGAKRGRALTGEQQAKISGADTFFVASFHPETGADASHRGGMPGFVEVADEKTLLWPDYVGNKMFNTLGNLAENPKAGLLFADFEGGDALQLTGEAKVLWDAERAARFAGAERLVEFRVEEAIEIADASPLRWRFLEYSPFNPRPEGARGFGAGPEARRKGQRGGRP